MKLNFIGKNMTVLHVGNASILFSYETPVAAKFAGIYYRTNEKCTKTITSHINKWLKDAPARESFPNFFLWLVHMETEGK